jgi:integrase
MPVVNPKKQKTPSLTGDIVTGIIATREYTYRDSKRNVDVERELKDVHRMLFILCAASGLRFGEALGIEIPNVSQDGSRIRICKKVWQGQMHDFLKTKNGEREIDLHPSVAKVLRKFIGERKSGLLFRSRTGRPLHQSNILRRVLHPILAQLGQPKCGLHAFRRFRNTYLRNYTSTPPGVYRLWMGHASADRDTSVGAGESMSDRYDKAEHERALRGEWAERAGLGFKFPSRIRVIGPNGPKLNSETPEEMAVSA